MTDFHFCVTRMDESRGCTFILWLFVIGFYIKPGSGAYELLLSCGNSVVSGSDCTMTCDTKDPAVTAILWLNGTTGQTTIDKNVDCTDAGDLPYESSCNTPGKFNLKITNAQYGRDSYAWSCTNPFGGEPSNATDGDTFVSVNLTRVTLTRSSATSISCVAVSSPAATVKLYEGSPPSQDNVVKKETRFTKTMDGLETNLISPINESKTYYCRADNGVGPGVISVTSVPESSTTVPLTTVTLTRTSATFVSCVAVSNPAATLTLYEVSPPSQDIVVKTETSFARTMDGPETQLTSQVEDSKTYYCNADNGVVAVNSTTIVPAPPTTTPLTPET